MNMRMNNVVCSLLTAGVMLGGVSNSFAKITGADALTAKEYQQILGRGIAASWFKNKFSNKSQGDDLMDFRARGFDHVRYRINAEIFSGNGFDQIESEIYRCISEDLIPVISWINHSAELNATDADMNAYVDWWEDLAIRFKGQHLVAFNLFTEINDGTKIFTEGKYNPWMQAATDAIRAVDPNRIIILSSPNKTHKQLPLIDPAIYTGDDYMMVEWHLYASGPKQDGGQKNWVGDGSVQDRLNVTEPLDEGVKFTLDTGIECYFGAWMPMDNSGGSLTQYEVESFARFFLDSCSDAGIPWTVNADQHFYDAKNDAWLGVSSTTARTLDMEPVVDILVTQGEFGEGVATILDPNATNSTPVFLSSVNALRKAEVGTAYSDSLVSLAVDPDGDSLYYSAVSGPAWLSVNNDGTVSGTPDAGALGVNSWGVQVSDGKGGLDSATITVEVVQEIIPLTVDAGADFTVYADAATGLATITLNATGTGDIVDYVWKENGVRVGVGPSITLDATIGDHTYDVRVKDLVGDIVSDTVVVTVLEQIVLVEEELLAATFDADAAGWVRSNARRITNADKTYAGTGVLQISKGGSASYAVSTAGASNLKLSFAARTDLFDNGEFLTVEWFDGAAWNLLLDYASTPDKNYELIDLTLPAAAENLADFQLRFSSNAGGRKEKAYVDSVVLLGSR